MPVNTLIYHVTNYYFDWFFSSESNLALMVSIKTSLQKTSYNHLPIFSAFESQDIGTPRAISFPSHLTPTGLREERHILKSAPDKPAHALPSVQTVV